MSGINQYPGTKNGLIKIMTLAIWQNIMEEMWKILEWHLKTFLKH